MTVLTDTIALNSNWGCQRDNLQEKSNFKETWFDSVEKKGRVQSRWNGKSIWHLEIQEELLTVRFSRDPFSAKISIKLGLFDVNWLQSYLEWNVSIENNVGYE